MILLLKQGSFTDLKIFTDLPHIILKRAWNKLWPRKNDKDNNDGENKNIDNENIVQKCEVLSAGENIEINDVAEWVDIDKLDAGVEYLSDDELIQQVLDENGSEENDESVQEVEEPTKTITHTEV